MMVKIKATPYFSGYKATQTIKDFFAKNAGKWVDVETTTLFNDQYNTKEVRVHDSHIQEVKDDARIGMAKCGYCGTMLKVGEQCTKHTEPSSYSETVCSDYKMIPFDENNTFFIANPKGADTIKKVSMNDEKMFGTFRLEQLDGSLNYYRLKNNRERFCFRFDTKTQMFWLGDTMGNTRKKHLGIKAKSFKENELKEYLTNQMK